MTCLLTSTFIDFTDYGVVIVTNSSKMNPRIKEEELKETKTQFWSKTKQNSL